ncbi:MAG: hypothetical protein IKE64_08775 [Thermoguttaceae bacterium]|nr:hypothetical protein [Thermoguttaceae bacterium]
MCPPLDQVGGGCIFLFDQRGVQDQLPPTGQIECDRAVVLFGDRPEDRGSGIQCLDRLLRGGTARKKGGTKEKQKRSLHGETRRN